MSLTDRARSVVTDSIRVTDLDFQRHVGNTAFTDILANARFVFLNEFVRPAVGFEDTMLVLVHLEVDFSGQVHHPAQVETTTSLGRLGRTSMQLRQTMRCADREVVNSTAVFVLVDRSSGASIEWPETLRDTASVSAPVAGDVDQKTT